MLHYGHKSVIKGTEKAIISNIAFNAQEAKRNQILYICALPDIEKTLISLICYFEKTSKLEAEIGIFSKQGNAIIKYHISKEDLRLNFDLEEGADYTPIFAGKSFSEIIGTDKDKDYFLGLEFLSDTKEKNIKKAVFIMRYI